MPTSDGRGIRKLYGWTVFCVGLLIVAPACLQLLNGPPLGGGWTAPSWAYLLSGWVGFFLPFAAFAGGVASGKTLPWPSAALHGAALAAASFVLIGFVSPQAEFRAAEIRGFPVATRYPTGPLTTLNLRTLREEIRQDPPAEYSLSVEDPKEHPPNWLTYLIHTPAVLAVFLLFSLFIGRSVSRLSTGLPPPLRANVHWASGLLSGVLFFVAENLGGDWARADPARSGILGAWVPLVVPAVVLLGLLYISSSRPPTATVFSRQASND